MTAHRALIVGAALFGACATQLLFYRWVPLVEMLRWETFSELVRFDNWDDVLTAIAGAIAGALSARLLWVAARPWQRISRPMIVCANLNVAVWIAFLVISPPLTSARFQRIAEERVERDRDSGSSHYMTDVPIVVAGRWHGTWGPVNFADWLLTLFAGPAIAFAEPLIVPGRYMGGASATKGESFAIAALGVLLSTAFWATLGGFATALRRAYNERIKRRLKLA